MRRGTTFFDVHKKRIKENYAIRINDSNSLWRVFWDKDAKKFKLHSLKPCHLVDAGDMDKSPEKAFCIIDIPKGSDFEIAFRLYDVKCNCGAEFLANESLFQSTGMRNSASQKCPRCKKLLHLEIIIPEDGTEPWEMAAMYWESFVVKIQKEGTMLEVEEEKKRKGEWL